MSLESSYWKNGILVVELGGLDTKIMFLWSKIKKLQEKMLIFTTVHEIALGDPQGLIFFKICFAAVIFSPKGSFLTQGESKIKYFMKK